MKLKVKVIEGENHEIPLYVFGDLFILSNNEHHFLQAGQTLTIERVMIGSSDISKSDSDYKYLGKRYRIKDIEYVCCGRFTLKVYHVEEIHKLEEL